MADLAVVNASPLIYLTRAGRLELLRLAGGEIVVPAAVAREVGQWGHDDPTARALADLAWLRVVPDLAASPSIQAWDLGPGETAVLAWASRNDALAVVEELRIAGMYLSGSVQDRALALVGE